MPFELRTVSTLIAVVGELDSSDLDVLAVMGSGVEGAVSGTRIKHHKIAQLAACGMKHVEIAELIGYTPAYISILLSSPAVQGLVSEYIKSGWTEIEAVTRRARMAASAGLTELHRRIEQTPNLLSTKDLTTATLGLLDRGGITQRHAHLHFGLSSTEIAALLRTAAQDDDSRVVEIFADSEPSSEVGGDSERGAVLETRSGSEG